MGMPGKTSLRTVLARGIRRRCPRCGEGPLFRRGIRAFERCDACGLLYQRNNGDTWMFTIITDRIPILFGVAAVYFGFRPDNWLATAALFAALLVSSRPAHADPTEHRPTSTT